MGVLVARGARVAAGLGWRGLFCRYWAKRMEPTTTAHRYDVGARRPVHLSRTRMFVCCLPRLCRHGAPGPAGRAVSLFGDGRCGRRTPGAPPMAFLDRRCGRGRAGGPDRMEFQAAAAAAISP